MADNPQSTFRRTTFTNEGAAFWHNKREIVRDKTLPYQLGALKSTGRYDAFKLQWKDTYSDPPDVPPVPNHQFWDSDVAKWIEGACYFLDQNGNDSPDLRSAITELVEMIQSAQQADGYLNIHFTVVDPEGRFSNIRDLHELYNAGHLIEAAIAHHELTQSNTLLGTLDRYVDLLHKEFGPGPNQRHAYPGHPEIELALLRLYRKTRDPKQLELGRYFLTERGNPTGQNEQHFYTYEASQRGERFGERPSYYPKAQSYWYQQAHKPIAQQETVEGHSVRAMYLLTAVADLIHIDADSSVALKPALFRLWDNMVDRKMYMTGGIGAHYQWEGFGIDYFLPQSSDEGGCYAETCAAIGVVMLAERLLQIDLESRYADTMELCLYNAVLTGMSLDGTKFTYNNPLASSAEHPSKREDWFKCACCPPNVTRLLGSLGGYFWSWKMEEEHVYVNVHQYASCTMSVPLPHGKEELNITQVSGYPWDGTTRFSIATSRAGTHVPSTLTLRLRVPAWARKEFTLAPHDPEATVEKGYLRLSTAYISANREFSITFPMRPRLISPHPYANQNVVALARGPLVYCVEDVDHPWVEDHFKDVVISTDLVETVEPEELRDRISGEKYVGLNMTSGVYRRMPQQPAAPSIAVKEFGSGQGVAADIPWEKPVSRLHFVPYYFRANRGGSGQMRVGLRKA